MNRRQLVKFAFDMGQRNTGVRKAPRIIENYLKFPHWDVTRSLEIYNNDDVNMYNILATQMKRVLGERDNTQSVVLGGDHSISFATVHGTAAAAARTGGTTKVLWIDAHADLNTPESSLSGNYHGMPLGALCGLFPSSHPLSKLECIRPQDILYVGLRDTDPFENEMIQTHNIPNFTSAQVHQDPVHVMDEIKKWAEDSDNVHVSLDIDVADPTLAPGTGTPVGHGLSQSHLVQLVDVIREDVSWKTFEFVEVNPELDDEDDKTSKLTASLVQRLCLI